MVEARHKVPACDRRPSAQFCGGISANSWGSHVNAPRAQAAEISSASRPKKADASAGDT